MKESRTPRNFARSQAVRIRFIGSKTVAAKWPVKNSRRASSFICRQTNSASSGECVHNSYRSLKSIVSVEGSGANASAG